MIEVTEDVIEDLLDQMSKTENTSCCGEGFDLISFSQEGNVVSIHYQCVGCELQYSGKITLHENAAKEILEN